MIYDALQTSLIHGAVVVAIVEAIRKRVPSVDGNKVFPVAIAISLLICGLFVDSSSPLWIQMWIRDSTLSCIVAMGGNAWAVRILSASNGGLTTSLDKSASPNKDDDTNADGIVA